MNKTVSTPHKCPVCKKYEFPFQNSYEICEICGWIDSSYQEHNPNVRIRFVPILGRKQCVDLGLQILNCLVRRVRTKFHRFFLRHAVNKFNISTTLEGFDFTVDEALGRMSMLHREKGRLYALLQVPEKTRVHGQAFIAPKFCLIGLFPRVCFANFHTGITRTTETTWTKNDFPYLKYRMSEADIRELPENDSFKAIYRILRYLEKAMDYDEPDIERISADAIGITSQRWT